MILETHRLILKHYQLTDKVELSKICSDNEVMKFVFKGAVKFEMFDVFVNEYFASTDS